MFVLSQRISQWTKKKRARKSEETKDRGMEGRGTMASWSSILVPWRPTLHLLSFTASHQKGIYRVPWLQAPSLASIIICASGVRQNWPCINKQKGHRTVNKQHIRDNQHCRNETKSVPQMGSWTRKTTKEQAHPHRQEPTTSKKM